MMVVIMIVIMVMMVVIMIVIMVMMVVIIVIVMFVVMVMIHVGGHDTCQADGVMWMVVAVTTAIVCRGRSGIERHNAETSCGGGSEGHDSFMRHEGRSF